MKNESYEEFVEKFKIKKTTDECFTPQGIYNVVAEFVANDYGIDKSKFVRPFFPGGDYTKFDYTDKVVVDNPPFSILKEIKEFYKKNNIKFFLFAPALTLFSSNDEKLTYIAIGATIIYENGARVNTSFVTNMDDENIKIRTVSELYKKLDSFNKENTKQAYEYDYNIITSPMMSNLSKIGIDTVVKCDECYYTNATDELKKIKKRLYGGGFIVSDRIAEYIRKSKEISNKKLKINISDQERKIVENLNVNSKKYETGEGV